MKNLCKYKTYGYRVLSIIFMSSLLSISCTTIDDSTQTSSDPLKTVYENYFLVGAAVSVGEYGFNSFENYSEDILSEFNSFVAENCMKPEIIHPSKDVFNWDYADTLIDYAQEYNMDVRGHTLVWHNQTPDWMFLSSGTQTEKKDYAKTQLTSHIENVVTHFADSVYCWDVVNEAITDSDGSSSIYRTDSPWYEAYGDGTYIVDAFDAARETDSSVLLYYNDYSLVNSTKRDRVVQMITELELQEHGLTGIGIQAHWNMSWPTISDIQETIDVFSDMGLDVQITELDIDCYNNSSSSVTKDYDSFEASLAQRYEDLFKLFRKNKDKISGVTFWGVADDHTWLDTFYGGSTQTTIRKNYPFLFDSNQEEKDAYYSVIQF